MEKILRKVDPGRQVECKIKGQHKINCKIKRVNDDNGKTREEENMTQDYRKTEIFCRFLISGIRHAIRIYHVSK